MKDSLLRKILFAACLLFLWNSSHAQDCTDANVAGLPGKWKLETTGWSRSSKADMLKEKSTMDQVSETIRKNFTWSPLGGDIRYGSFWESNDHRPDPVQKICNIYYTRLAFSHFFCSNHKIEHEDAADLFYTLFNELPFQFDHSFYTAGPKATDGGIDPQTDTYALLNWLPDVKDGYFDYILDGFDGTGNSPGKILRYRTLIKSGKLPYVVMSKKEYYEKWKNKYQIEITNYEAQKVKISKELAGNPGLTEVLEGVNQMITVNRNWMDKIDAILKTRSAEELAKPALQLEEQGKYFESSRESSDFLRPYIVKPNMAYFNDKLTKSSPQVITLSFRYYMGNDGQGNKNYSDENFYKALDNMKIFDMLTEKLKPLIVQ